MARGNNKERVENELHAQIITDRDGKPILAALPIEVLAALLVYVREGAKHLRESDTGHQKKPQKNATDRSVAWLSQCFDRDKFFTSWDDLQATFATSLHDDYTYKALKSLQDLLLTNGGGADGEDAADVAAFDAAKARNEESFPAEIADRLIAGDNPIKVFRKYRGLTQKQLAKQAKTAAAYLSQIETGRRIGSVKLLRRLAGELGVGLDDLT